MYIGHPKCIAIRKIIWAKKQVDFHEIMEKNILLQGYPGVGKTTVIKKTIHGIGSAGGFYTEEIREGSRRRGFKITTLEGKQGTLAYKVELTRRNCIDLSDC